MFYSTLAPPSTARNTLGEFNNSKLQEAYDPASLTEKQFEDRPSDAATAENPAGGVPESQLEDNAKYIFGPRVTRAYGADYGTSPILVDYFRDLKTKD